MLPSLGELQGMVRQIIDEREEADLQLAILASMSTESAAAPAAPAAAPDDESNETV